MPVICIADFSTSVFLRDSLMYVLNIFQLVCGKEIIRKWQGRQTALSGDSMYEMDWAQFLREAAL